jgi:uncharacterized protein YecE (DUF72 family)
MLGTESRNRKVAAQEPRPKVPRKKPEERAVLYARIKRRDEIIDQLKEKVQEQHANMLKIQNRIIQLENQLKTR